MTSLQENIIKRYREKYPNQTLKEISNLTGIQITRVHRIFSGSEMKLKEFEAFEKALTRSQSSLSNEILNSTFECISTLKDAKLNEILNKMNYILKLEELKNSHLIEQLTQQQLA